MAQPLAQSELQCVVVGNAFRLIKGRIGIDADIRRAQSRVSALEGLQSLGRQKVEAVRIGLAVDGVGRGGDAGLVERNRQHLVYAVIAT